MSCTSLKRIYVSDLWSIESVTDQGENMFYGDTGLVGAVAYDDTNYGITMANYQTGYLTHINDKPEELLIIDAIDYQETTKIYLDDYGNEIVVPAGFKARPDLATLAEDGIVIEDEIGNQFVWVPIGNVALSNGTTTIDLGRYSFNNSTGEATLVDNAQTVVDTETYTDISSYSGAAVTETATNSDYPTSDEALLEWLESAISNKGYYISRFEIGTMNGDYVSMEGIDNAIGDSVVAKNGASAVIEGNDYVESRLVNSFAWDTALHFIQQCSGNTTYSALIPSDFGSLITGDSGDVECNIYDMALNASEWTTEHSTDVNVVRGGAFGVGWDSYPLWAGIRMAYPGLDTSVNTPNLVLPGIGFRATLLVDR